MLPKRGRVRRKHPLGKKITEGRTPFLLLRVFLREENPPKGGEEEVGPKASFLIPKKIEKSAVKRNTLRRKGYEALGPLLSSVDPRLTLLFLLLKKPPARKEVVFFTEEYKNLLSQKNLLSLR